MQSVGIYTARSYLSQHYHSIRAPNCCCHPGGHRQSCPVATNNNIDSGNRSNSYSRSRPTQTELTPTPSHLSNPWPRRAIELRVFTSVARVRQPKPSGSVYRLVIYGDRLRNASTPTRRPTTAWSAFPRVLTRSRANNISPTCSLMKVALPSPLANKAVDASFAKTTAPAASLVRDGHSSFTP